MPRQPRYRHLPPVVDLYRALWENVKCYGQVMAGDPKESEGIGIAKLDLSKIEEYLTPRLNSFTASDNRYFHEGTWKEPKFTVVAIVRHEIAIDAVLAVETDCEAGLALAGYEVVGASMRYRHDRSEFILYNAVASNLWADQLAGDYPIGKIDFTDPCKITWPTFKKHEVYLHTLEELLEYNQQCKGSDDFWLNADFIETLKTRRNLA